MGKVMADSSKLSPRTEAKFSLKELKAEFARKGLHILIAAVPSLAAVSLSNTALLLMGGILFYTWAESMRFLGIPMPVISSVTEAVLRKREQGRFALGPATLGLGALLSLLLFPPSVAAAAIYALAFGDSAAGIIGRFLGRFRPAFLAGKSLEGSLACFAAAFFAGFLVFREWKIALAVGLGSMLADALPIKDFDNLLLPLAAGLCALIFL
jgi:dolichol kinase